MHFRSIIDTSRSRTRRIQFVIFNFIKYSISLSYLIFILTANETITNLTQYELFQEESDLLKVDLYFSIQPDKVRKSEIFTIFEKIHRSFFNSLESEEAQSQIKAHLSEEAQSQIKAHLSYLANSYFYNYKPSPRILRQHCVVRNYRKNKDIVITKPNKGHGLVMLDRKLYNNTIEEIISDTSKFQKLSEYPTLKCEASLQHFFFCILKQTMKLNMINCILLVLLLLVSMVLLKCTNSPLVILFLNFV